MAARCARAEANADDRVFAQLVAGGFGTASGGSRKLRPSRSTDQAIHVEFPSRGITAHLVERRPPVATLGAADAVILVNLDASGVPMEISTSYAERGNLSIRMACRRFARLTNAFSKKLENHAAAVALYVAHYNFCRVHKTLETTPAIALGITDHVWSIGELIGAALGAVPPKPTPTAPDRRRQFMVIRLGRP